MYIRTFEIILIQTNMIFYIHNRIFCCMYIGIAVCFDYTLFMVNRFREELLVNKYSRQEAVYRTIASSGHVIALSGE